MFRYTPHQSDVRQLLRSDVNRSLSSLSQIESQLNWFSASIAYIDNMATSLPSRFKALRVNGFVHRVSVEHQLNELVSKWNATRSSVSDEIEAFSQQLRSEVNALKNEGNLLLNRINQPFLIEFALRADVMKYTSKVNNLTSKAHTQIDNAKRGFSELRANIEKIGEVVAEGEEAINAAQSASVAILEREHPILCVKAKKQGPGEKNEGRIIVTDQRILYEVEKQVVLEKKLFIATKTKVDRVLDLEIPLGVVAKANKGRLGLIAWEGIYIELKPGQKFEEVVFDTSGDETEKLVEAINYVLSGQADKDKALVMAEEKVVGGPKAFFCLKCGAPLDVATTRGIAEVECKYCGTRNKIQ